MNIFMRVLHGYTPTPVLGTHIYICFPFLKARPLFVKPPACTAIDDRGFLQYLLFSFSTSCSCFHTCRRRRLGPPTPCFYEKVAPNRRLPRLLFCLFSAALPCLPPSHAAPGRRLCQRFRGRTVPPPRTTSMHACRGRPGVGRREERRGCNATCGSRRHRDRAAKGEGQKYIGWRREE